MRSIRLPLWFGLACSLFGCGGKGGDGKTQEPAAPTSYLVPLLDGQRVDTWGGALVDGAPVPVSASDSSAGVRIEESDVYKVDGNLLYVLNRHRGLQIVDLGNPGAPRLIGRVPIYGQPSEIYLRGSLVLILVGGSYLGQGPLFAASGAGFSGSQVQFVDVSDPRRPRVVGSVDVAGDVVDSRIVGDFLYVVSSRWAWQALTGDEDGGDRTEVVSLSLHDPTDLRAVARLALPRVGWDHHIATNDHAIYLASAGWSDGAGSFATEIFYLDITDPSGEIRLRGKTKAPGRILDRWCLDEHAGVLRVASAQNWGNGDVYLTTYSVADPDRIEPLGSAVLSVKEQLTAARFDGLRGYLVSVARIDPLFSFDLSDPVHPALLGELEMTGWLDHVVPLGGHLVALGHDQTPDGKGGVRTTLAVSLIDASAQGPPSLLSRIPVGEDWGSVPGDRDDIAKVFKVIPSAGLVLVPFQSWSPVDGASVGGVQLVDYDDRVLTLRGLAAASGWIDRGISWDEGTLLTLSSEVLQVFNVADRDSPTLRARLELARDVRQFGLLPGGHGLELAVDPSAGMTRLFTVARDDPDGDEPFSEVALPLREGRLFLNGSAAYVVGFGEPSEGEDAGRSPTGAEVVDFADPARPVRRGGLLLPGPTSSFGWRGSWGVGDEVVQVGGSLLALHPGLSVPYLDGGPRPEALEPGSDHVVYLVDLADPDRPRLAATVPLDGAVAWSSGLSAQGDTLYLSDYQMVEREGAWYARYFLRRIEVSDPYHPVVLPAVNVPGAFVGASRASGHVFTLESWWDASTGRQRSRLNSLLLEGDSALLRNTVELAGWVTGIEVDGTSAFAVAQPDAWAMAAADAIQATATILWGVDLTDPEEMRLTGKVEVPAPGGWLQKVAGDRAFISGSGGLFVYSGRDPGPPVLEGFHPTQGWAHDLMVAGDRAFLSSGFSGVQVIPLTTP